MHAIHAHSMFPLDKGHIDTTSIPWAISLNLNPLSHGYRVQFHNMIFKFEVVVVPWIITCYAFWICFLDVYACLLVSCPFGVRSYVIMKLVPLRYTLLISMMIALLYSSRIVQTMVGQNVPYNCFLLTLFVACMITSHTSK